jgi:hypothetical protein
MTGRYGSEPKVRVAFLEKAHSEPSFDLTSSVPVSGFRFRLEPLSGYVSDTLGGGMTGMFGSIRDIFGGKQCGEWRRYYNSKFDKR